VDPKFGDQYVRKVTGPAYIEPVFGYIITEQGCLLEDSMLHNASNLFPPWRQGTPSFPDFQRSIKNSAQVAEYKSVISLRHWWEWNFYHFFHDVLGKMQLMDAIGLPTSMPLVVGAYAGELQFAKQSLAIGKLADRDWVIQCKQYIKADEIYYNRTKESLKARMDYILDQMGVPVPPSDGGEKIYLKRGRNAKRLVANADEIEELVAARGFRIVDTDGWDMRQQIELFANTRYLLGAHGAGMTNMIYRRTAPLSVLELRPESWVSTVFERLANDFGHPWSAIAGPPLDKNAGQGSDYRIAPADLNAALDVMLAE
jgi:hypothetical protein